MGFEIMRDIVKEIPLDFDVKKPYEVAMIKAISRAQAATMEEDDKMLGDLKQPAEPSNTLAVTNHNMPFSESDKKDV